MTALVGKALRCDDCGKEFNIDKYQFDRDIHDAKVDGWVVAKRGHYLDEVGEGKDLCPKCAKPPAAPQAPDGLMLILFFNYDGTSPFPHPDFDDGPGWYIYCYENGKLFGEPYGPWPTIEKAQEVVDEEYWGP